MRESVRYAIAFVILTAVTALAHLSTAPYAQTRPAQQLDLLILRGKLVDGSGRKPRIIDVGIRADRIVFVGDSRKMSITALRTIDANGLVVAPGFIDPHTHTLSDLSDQQRKSNKAYLMQGVTTVVTGNDGGSVLNIGDMLRQWDEQGIGTNAPAGGAWHDSRECPRADGRATKCGTARRDEGAGRARDGRRRLWFVHRSLLRAR